MPDEQKPPEPKPGDLLAEQAAALGPAAAAMGPTGMALAGLGIAQQVLTSAGTQGSASQLLGPVAGGGGGHDATGQAMLAALNRLAGLRSRM